MDIEKNKMIKAFLVLFMGLFLAFLVAGCGGQKTAEKPAEQAKPAAPQQEKIVVKLNGTLPVGHYLTKAIEKYKEIVESKAGDRVEIQLYPAQQLYSDKDIVQVLPRGGVEMGLIQSFFNYLSTISGSASSFSLLKYRGATGKAGVKQFKLLNDNLFTCVVVNRQRSSFPVVQRKGNCIKGLRFNIRQLGLLRSK